VRMWGGVYFPPPPPPPNRRFRSCFLYEECTTTIFERHETVLIESDPENIFVPTAGEVDRMQKMTK